MSTAMKTHIVLAASLALTAACQNVGKSSKANKEKQLSGEYNAILGSDSKIKISDRALIAVYDPAAASSSTAPGAFNSDKYAANVYPLAKANCGPCHVDNKYPFAGSGPFAAADAAKDFINLTTPETSKMVTNIQAGHSGVNPTLAPQFIEAIKKMAQ